MKGKKGWRLTKTLGRRVQINPIEDSDVKFAWAAYSKGGFSQMGFSEGMNPAEFKAAFESFVLANALSAWTVSAFVQKRGRVMPIGIVLGQSCVSMMVIAAVAWFPWASCRNVVEGTIGFFNAARKEMKVMGFATDDHKPLYEACCAHGIMRRIGTSHNLLGDRAAVFEGIN